MNRKIFFVVCIVAAGLAIMSCNLVNSFLSKDQETQSTQAALAVQQTSVAVEQTRLAEVEPAEADEPSSPSQADTQIETLEPTREIVEQPTEIEPVVEPESELTFDEWIHSAQILLYDDMYGLGATIVMQDALDGLRLRSNTTNVKDAMGDLLSQLNSATQWDLIIIGAESRDNISGEYFDALAEQMERGASIILEVWYIDDITYGRIQPVMQQCGINFQEDWQREVGDNLNLYLVHLLDPEHPLFSDPNPISMLIPHDVMWYGDVGDFLKVKPDSEARLLGGLLQNDDSKFGLLAECMNGRMIWQTFSTHDYKTQVMIDLWQNYITNTLKARYEYLQN